MPVYFKKKLQSTGNVIYANPQTTIGVVSEINDIYFQNSNGNKTVMALNEKKKNKLRYTNTSEVDNDYNSDIVLFKNLSVKNLSENELKDVSVKTTIRRFKTDEDDNKIDNENLPGSRRFTEIVPSSALMTKNKFEE